MRNKNTRFSKQKYNIKMNHQTSHPPSDMDQNETTPSVKCWTASRHPPSQDLVFGSIRSPSCALRWTDWAHPPSRFGLVPILNKAALKVLDGSTLPPFGVEIGFKKRTGLLCDLLDAPGPPPCAEREVYSIWKHPPVRFAGQDFLTLLRTLPPFAYLASQSSITLVSNDISPPPKPRRRGRETS